MLHEVCSRENVQRVERLLLLLDVRRKGEAFGDHVLLQLLLDALDLDALLSVKGIKQKDQSRAKSPPALLLHLGTRRNAVDGHEQQLLGVHRRQEPIEVATLKRQKSRHFWRFSNTSSSFLGMELSTWPCAQS